MTLTKETLYTNAQIALWFGISEKSFRTCKKKKLEELKRFANFEERKGKIYIIDVYIDTYSKGGSRTYEIVKSEFDEEWDKSGIDSCSRVSCAIELKRGKELNAADSTLYQYTRKSRTELYGIPYSTSGTRGTCEYIWCKKIGEGIDSKYIELSPEEEQIKKDLITKYFGDTTEKNLMIKAMILRGEIKKEEAWDLLENITNMHDNGFMSFLKELQTKLGGCKIVRGTKINKFIQESEFGAF